MQEKSSPVCWPTLPNPKHTGRKVVGFEAGILSGFWGYAGITKVAGASARNCAEIRCHTNSCMTRSTLYPGYEAVVY